MTYKTIIALAGLFGLFQLFKTTNNFARLILLGQIIAIAFTFVPNDTITIAGLILFMVTQLAVIIYGLAVKDLTTKKRLTIIVMAAFVLVANFFMLQHYKYANEIGSSMLIPIGAYLLALVFNFKNYKNEIGFLTIIAVDAVIKLMEYVRTMIEQNY